MKVATVKVATVSIKETKTNFVGANGKTQLTGSCYQNNQAKLYTTLLLWDKTRKREKKGKQH